MGHALRLLAVGAAALALQGCLARTAVGVATAPVRIASRGVDLATTSQSESDQKRGREIRQREERLGKLERDYAREARRCQDGDREACDRAEAIDAEIEQLLPTIPAEPVEN